MSEVPEKGKMTDVQKAKDAYSIHQDSLLWSRVQTLIAIQTATLAGTYAVGPRDWVGALLLTLLGLFLTGLLFIIAKRDQLHRDQSSIASGVRETHINPPFPFSLKGGQIIELVFLILVCADIIILPLRTVGRCSLWLTVTVFFVACIAWSLAHLEVFAKRAD